MCFHISLVKFSLRNFKAWNHEHWCFWWLWSDGEIDAFKILRVVEVAKMIRSSAGSYKPNSALVVIDFLYRHGFVLIIPSHITLSFDITVMQHFRSFSLLGSGITYTAGFFKLNYSYLADLSIQMNMGIWNFNKHCSKGIMNEKSDISIALLEAWMWTWVHNGHQIYDKMISWLYLRYSWSNIKIICWLTIFAHLTKDAVVVNHLTLLRICSNLTPYKKKIFRLEPLK